VTLPPSAPSSGLVLPDAALEAEIRDDLRLVENLLRDSVKSDYPFVTEMSRHLVDAGGKRFRPLLVLLAARFGNPSAPGIVPAAAVVELTHLATLYHDDVMDEALQRRGVPSANARWDNTIAILTGDFLFARASDLLADLGPEAVRIQARTFERLVVGQIRETVGPTDGADPVQHYLSVLADKTGSLMATSGRFGAMLSGADPDVVETLTGYGERIGVAFQLSDDLLDVSSESEESGKTPGTDLREGVATLPVLHVRRSDDPGDDRLRELLDGPLVDDADHAEALGLLRVHPAMESARTEVRRRADEARALLANLPDIPARTALESLCDVVVERTG
jgi:geranylgeranyl pyrophosphate synthase